MINNRFFNQQWGLKLIKAEGAWQLLSNNDYLNGNTTQNSFGSPDINITIVDGGVETKNNLSVHKGFEGQISDGKNKLLQNIIDESKLKFDFKDYLRNTHGMEVGGIATAKVQLDSAPYDGEGIVGVAPNCSFYSVNTGFDFLNVLTFISGMAGLESMLPVNADRLNAAYNFINNKIDKISGLHKIGTVEDTPSSYLNSFLNNRYTDVFNLSLEQISDSDMEYENYSKVIFNEISFFGRKGRGCVSVVSAGNKGLVLERAPNQFENEYAYSNKPIIVGAVSVDNNYNWTSNDPLSVGKSSYSNYGNRLDICAPGAESGENDKNKIFTITAKGAGQLQANSPLKLTLRKKIEVKDKTPSDPVKYEYVTLQFDNINGVQEGQKVVLGDFNTPNSLKFFEVIKIYDSLPLADGTTVNLVVISYMEKSIYNSLIDSTDSNPSVIEFLPMYTKITAVLSNDVIEVENVKGAFRVPNGSHEEIYIGGLGNGSSGIKSTIKSVDPNTNQITLHSGVLANVGDYVVFPQKSSQIISPSVNGDKTLTVRRAEGFFIGAEVGIIDSVNPAFFIGTKIESIESNTITLTSPVTFTNTGSNLTLRTLSAGDISTEFFGTSAAAPFVTGAAALILSANRNLSSAEVKHILKETASSTSTATGTGIPAYSLNSDDYLHNVNYGTGLVDTEKAVKLAFNWHRPDQGQSLLYPDQPVLKPRLEIADKLDTQNCITAVLDSEKVDSPDIWVKPLDNTIVPSEVINAGIDQKICVKVRNTGNRQSFKECDLRVLLAFTDEVNPKFPFPDYWHDKQDNSVVLLSVKEIPIIPAGGDTTIEIEWKDIVKNWNIWNPAINGKRKQGYILAHIAPFDGLPSDVAEDDIRHNKQLTCKPIRLKNITVSLRNSAYIPGNNFNITVGTELVSKSFDLSMENIATSALDNLQIKATIKYKDENIPVETVAFKKDGNNWALESGYCDWIAFDTPTIETTDDPNYCHAVFPHTLTVNHDEQEVTLEIV